MTSEKHYREKVQHRDYFFMIFFHKKCHINLILFEVLSQSFAVDGHQSDASDIWNKAKLGENKNSLCPKCAPGGREKNDLVQFGMKEKAEAPQHCKSRRRAPVTVCHLCVSEV